MDLKIFIRF